MIAFAQCQRREKCGALVTQKEEARQRRNEVFSDTLPSLLQRAHRRKPSRQRCSPEWHLPPPKAGETVSVEAIVNGLRAGTKRDNRPGTKQRACARCSGASSRNSCSCHGRDYPDTRHPEVLNSDGVR
jgi:hypothetical protein